MNTQQEYILEEVSSEDQLAFKNGVDELLEKLSLQLNLIINKRPITIKQEDGTSVVTFTDEPSLVLQKKVIVPEVVKEDIKSPLSDEMTNNEPNKEV